MLARLAPLPAIAALALTAGLAATSADAQPVGVETFVRTANTTEGGGSFVGGSTASSFEGGEDFLFISDGITNTDGITNAYADITGAAPALGAAAANAGSDNTGGSAFAASITAYQFVADTTGGSGSVAFNYSLTGTLAETTTPESSATLRARGAFVTDLDFFSTDISSYVEGYDVADSFNDFTNIAGVVANTGSISIDPTDGDIFTLTLTLNATAGDLGASSNALSTLTGSFNVTGGTLVAVPEPAAATLLLAAGLPLLHRRRRA